MSKIHIKYMSDETLETLRENIDETTSKLLSSPQNSSWIEKVASGKTFVEKKFTVDDFGLKLPKDSKDKDTDFENSIILYEHLKELPKYVLTDERFWSWINFEKGYETALIMMPVQEGGSVFKDHWLFTQGKRRGLFFGVLSRCFYRVDLTIEPGKPDPYELTRFVIENPERFRNLSWRAFSSERHIVHGVLRAEKQLLEEYGFEKNSLYPEVAKYVSQMGSVMLLDVMDEDSIRKQVYRKFEQLVQEEMDRLLTSVVQPN